jgi:hypothetical protein
MASYRTAKPWAWNVHASRMDATSAGMGGFRASSRRSRTIRFRASEAAQGPATHTHPRAGTNAHEYIAAPPTAPEPAVSPLHSTSGQGHTRNTRTKLSVAHRAFEAHKGGTIHTCFGRAQYVSSLLQAATGARKHPHTPVQISGSAQVGRGVHAQNAPCQEGHRTSTVAQRHQGLHTRKRKERVSSATVMRECACACACACAYACARVGGRVLVRVRGSAWGSGVGGEGGGRRRPTGAPACSPRTR